MVKVVFTPSAFKSLKSIPAHIVSKLKTWVADVELVGLERVRKLPGFHDEPLKGKRAGQRSIRLNRAYRAIYQESGNAKNIVVTVIEVNKHDY